MNHPSDTLPSNASFTNADRLCALYTADEIELTKALAAASHLTTDQRQKIGKQAATWVEKVRAATHRTGVIDAFLQEYGLSTKEGIILMRFRHGAGIDARQTGRG
jgi:Mg/Co/Ni transporter MgtE